MKRDEYTECSKFTYKGKTYNFVSRLGQLITGEIGGKEKKINEMADTFEWTKPFVVTTKGYEGVKFEIGKETTTLNLIQSAELLNTLKDFVESVAQITTYVEYYNDFDKKIDDVVKKSYNKENKEYSIGGNYAMFLKTVHSIPGTEIKMTDNHKAAEILKVAYKKKHSKDKLIFDSELSDCYIYTKDKYTAKRFLLWIYENYIKSWLNDNDVEHYLQFEEDYKNSSSELKKYFNHLMMKF